MPSWGHSTSTDEVLVPVGTRAASRANCQPRRSRHTLSTRQLGAGAVVVASLGAAALGPLHGGTAYAAGPGEVNWVNPGTVVCVANGKVWASTVQAQTQSAMGVHIYVGRVCDPVGPPTSGLGRVWVNYQGARECSEAGSGYVQTVGCTPIGSDTRGYAKVRSSNSGSHREVSDAGMAWG